MSEIRIVDYSLEWFEAHYTFASRNFGERRKRRNSDYIYWKFRGNSDNPLSSFLLAVTDDNEVVGQLGLIPSSVTIDQKVITCFWACDLMVDPKYRGQNIAKLLYTAAGKKGLIFGSSPSPAASASMRKFGFQTLKGPFFLFFNRNILDSLNWIFHKFGFNVKGSILNFSSALSLIVAWLFKKKVIIFKLDDLLERISRKNIKREEKHLVKFDRSSDFLNWRLRSFKDYQQDASNIAFGNSYISYLKDDQNNIYVGHIFYTSLVHLFILTSSLIFELFKHKGNYIYLNTPYKRESLMLLILGFWIRPRRVDLIYLDGMSELRGLNCTRITGSYTYFDSDERL